MNLDMAQAIDLIGSLREGDRVRVTREGRTSELIVSRGPRRSDGQFGSPESVQVTVTYGPGRYAFEVSAGHLVRTRRGRGWVGGGTKLEKIEGGGR